MKCRMSWCRAHRSISPWLATLLCLVLVSASAQATSFNNGKSPYDTQDEKDFTRKTKVSAGTELSFEEHTHSAIVVQSADDDYVSDQEFEGLVRTRLLTAGGSPAPRYNHLNIHMTQCYSGGFIDELDANTDITNFTINTAAVWSEPAWGQEGANPRSYWGSAWNWEVRRDTASSQMRNAYTEALDGNFLLGSIRAKQLPQYFSRPNGEDGLKLGTTTVKHALLFVGDDRQNKKDGASRRRRHFSGAQGMYSTLRHVYHFPAENIKIYYHDGTKPKGVIGNLPINGPATEANFNSFFVGLDQTGLEGSSDEVFVWTSDHGRIIGHVIAIITLVAGGSAVAEFELEFEDFFQEALSPLLVFDDPIIELFTDLPDSFVVSLNGTELGSVEFAGDSVSFPASLASSGANSLRFVTVNTGLAGSDVTFDYGINIPASCEQIVVPSLGFRGLGLLCGVLVLATGVAVRWRGTLSPVA